MHSNVPQAGVGQVEPVLPGAQGHPRRQAAFPRGPFQPDGAGDLRAGDAVDGGPGEGGDVPPVVGRAGSEALRSGAGAEEDVAVDVVDQVVGSAQGAAAVVLGQHGGPAVLFEANHPAGVPFADQQPALMVEGDPLGFAGGDLKGGEPASQGLLFPGGDGPLADPAAARIAEQQITDAAEDRPGQPSETARYLHDGGAALHQVVQAGVVGVDSGSSHLRTPGRGHSRRFRVRGRRCRAWASRCEPGRGARTPSERKGSRWSAAFAPPGNPGCPG